MSRDLPRFPGDDPDEIRRPTDERPVGDPIDAEPIRHSADETSDSADVPEGTGGAEGPEAGSGADDPEQRTYWTEVPRFLEIAERARKPRDEDDKAGWEEAPPRSPADRSEDAEGSWRGDGGRYLPAVRNADADEVAGRVRDREDAVTGNLREVVDLYLESGGHLVGLENRRKGDDRLKEKIAERLAEKPDRSVADIVADIPDVIRYTFQFSKQRYVDGYHEVTDRMEDLGYEQVKVKNSWDSPNYKGINTRWVTPDGQLFEVQFHTEESFHAKEEVTHIAYERLRNPLTNDEEAKELRKFQREVSSWIPEPDGVRDIPNHTKEGY